MSDWQVRTICARTSPSRFILTFHPSPSSTLRTRTKGLLDSQFAVGPTISTRYARTPTAHGPAFWSYQSGSYEKRPNWVLPLRAGFKQENYLGMNASDYGGGTPIVDVWRKDVGLAVGHIEPGPRLISLPVSMPEARHARVAVRSDPGAHAGTRRELSYSSHLCLRASRGLLSNAHRIPPPHGAAGISNGFGARQRFWPDLVRLGLWPVGATQAGLRHASNRQEDGLRVGHLGRWLAEQLRRLGSSTPRNSPMATPT